jgi:c-di-GMP-binding flagellar brake protein YcgR
LGLLTVYPFRCQLCTHRFLAFLWRYSASPKREYDRVPAQYPVTLYPASAQKQGEEIQGTTVNLSITGGLIETNAQVPQGTSVRLKIHSAALASPIEVEGAMVRAVLENRLALEFFKIAPEEEQRFRVFMEAHLLCRPR